MLKDRDKELKHRAVLDLHGFFVISTQKELIENPKIIIEALRPSEFFVMEFFEDLVESEKIEVEEGIVRDNVITVFGYDVEIDLEYTPAGVITSIARSVIELSLKYLKNEEGLPYEEKYDSVGYYESMQAIVSYYLNIPFTEVEKYTISELYQKHAICSKTFLGSVQPLMKLREEHLPRQQEE